MICKSRYLTPEEELKLLPQALYSLFPFIFKLFINDTYKFLKGLNKMFSFNITL